MSFRASMTGMRQGKRLGLTRDELRRDGSRLVIVIEWQAQQLTKRTVEGASVVQSSTCMSWLSQSLSVFSGLNSFDQMWYSGSSSSTPSSPKPKSWNRWMLA